MPLRHVIENLYYFKRPSRWTSGVGAALPDEYKKFWYEWKIQKPAAVHYVEKEGNWMRNRNGEVKPVQNVPLLIRYPKEHNEGIWGGEGVVQGYIKKSKYRRRVSHFWVPELKRWVLYSHVLDKHMNVVVTVRTLKLIHENYGFDHYLLKTPACDLKSELALKLKQKILVALADKTLYPEDPVKRDDVYSEYQHYLAAYTREEIEWYGLTFKEACKKYIAIRQSLNKPQPLKLQYRAELIAKLKEADAEEIMDISLLDKSASLISKLNPFANKTKTE